MISSVVLNSKIQLVRDYFSVKSLSDWERIDPRDVVAIDGVGPATLDHVRLYLAGQGLALKNDRTPSYWMEHLGRAKIVHQMSDHDVAVVCPFTILVDSAEQQPFEFKGIRADADQQYRPMLVKTEWRPLGRHPDGMGDYSIDGLVGQVHLERKSIPDLQGTLLAFGDRRDRFEVELSNLSRCKSAAVVVEGTIAQAVIVPERGKKPKQINAKIMLRSILAMQQDYAVPWFFCDDRRMAEVVAFRFLERFWRKQQERLKESERMLGSL